MLGRLGLFSPFSVASRTAGQGLAAAGAHSRQPNPFHTAAKQSPNALAGLAAGPGRGTAPAQAPQNPFEAAVRSAKQATAAFSTETEAHPLSSAALFNPFEFDTTVRHPLPGQGAGTGTGTLERLESWARLLRLSLWA